MEEIPQSVLHSLHVWEDSIKKRDEELKNKAEPKNEKRPPVRGTSAGMTSATNTIRYDDFGPLPDGKKLAEAITWKEKGNALFSQKQYKEAIEAYTKSIELDPDNTIYWSNRALAHLNLSNYRATIDDCSKAILLDSANVKAYLRRATAYKALNSPALALIDLQKASSLEPSNKQIIKDLDDIKKILSTMPAMPEQTIPASSTIQELPSTTDKTPTTPTSSSVTEVGEDFLLRPTTQKSSTSASTNLPSSTKPAKEETPTNKITVIPTEAKKPTAKKISSNVIVPRVFNVKPRVPTSPPATAYEFETTWRELKSDLSLLHTYIKLIDPKSYAALFKDALSSPILSSFLQVAKRFCDVESDFKGAKDILCGLLEVPRIDVLIMFMSSEEREELDALLDRLEKETSIDPEEAARVKKKFKQSAAA
eukprot:TRINITY_DN2583_c0_g1_i2.p2 TRINITY_DN2583_c0_g1~~TRINITY_DN2583_c0_g1_i2.p2  ORF type:complete len:423 (-),score=115.06 TRINITY_DN2583_c0_g1_i2:26-1294(-)